MVYNRTDVYYRSIQGHGIAKLKVVCSTLAVSVLFMRSIGFMRS